MGVGIGEGFGIGEKEEEGCWDRSRNWVDLRECISCVKSRLGTFVMDVKQLSTSTPDNPSTITIICF